MGTPMTFPGALTSGGSTSRLAPQPYNCPAWALTLSCLMMDWKQCSVPRYWGFSVFCTCSRTCRGRASEQGQAEPLQQFP